MRLQHPVAAPLLAAALALASGGWLVNRTVPAPRAGPRLVSQVMQYVATASVEERAPGELYALAARAVVDALGDPHSAVLTPEQYARLRMQTTGEYAGLGISIARHGGWITAVGVRPGTPAEAAGIRVGDRLVSVDGTSTAQWTAAEMVARMRGEDRVPVVLGVQQPGSARARRVRLMRIAIQVPSVPHAYLTRDGVGYVDLTVVAETSADELAAAVQRLKGQGMRALVLDLRGNPGGLLEQGVAVASLFLPRGRLVVATRGRDPRENESFSAGAPEAFPRLPLVVLVDGGTASAAEIVAGALQDHDRALVVGATSYGKGSVQTLFPLSGGSFLKLTTARWYTPAGRSIQKQHQADAPSAVADVGDAVARPDRSSGPGRRIAYRTDAGRIVYGGGGIVPDVVVAADSVDAARPFLAAAALRGDALDEVIFAFGVELARGHPELPRGFAVSPAMLAELETRLRQAGIDATPSAYGGASDLLARRLSHQVTLVRWGAAEAARRDAEGDAVLREAVRLLRAASTQADLLRAPAAAGPAPALALN